MSDTEDEDAEVLAKRVVGEDSINWFGKTNTRRLAQMVLDQQARIATLEAELEGHAFSLTPAMVQARNDQLNEENERLKQELTDSLRRNGDFRSELTFALFGTREQLPDDQILATAKSVRDELTRKQAIIKRSCEDWADDDTAIKRIAAGFGIREDDSPGEFKDSVMIVREMEGVLHRLEAERQQLLAKLDDAPHEDSCSMVKWYFGLPKPKGETPPPCDCWKSESTLPATGNGWLPIETAPKDGRRILGWCPDWGANFVKWSPGRPAPHWTVDSGAVTESAPTHWQPLPPPPAAMESNL